MEHDTPSAPNNAAAEGVVDPIERIILRSMAEGVITVECDGRIHMVNRSAERILGARQHELVGRKFNEVFGARPENREFEEVFVNLIHKGLLTTHKDVRFTREDEQTVDLAVATSFLDADECVPGMETVIAVFRDVTALKNLERARRRAVDHLSHELKTPLSIVDASVTRLVNKAGDGGLPEKTIQRIRRNLRRLNDIREAVEEALNPRPYTPRRLNLRDTVDGIIDRIRAEAAHRSVIISADADDVHTDIVDPEVLETALRTLVKNAVENTPDEGRVSVSAKQNESQVIVTVRDFGMGAPVEDREFLFEGFHHTQETDEYSSKQPYDFNAGGKGLELLRLKILSEAGYFDMSFDSRRCVHIPTARDHCPGRISDCPHIAGPHECAESGGTEFTLVFRPGVRSA